MQKQTFIFIGTITSIGAIYLWARKSLKCSKNLKNFVISKVLKAGENDASILGYFQDDPQQMKAVVLLQKNALARNDLEFLLKTIRLEEILRNDIYSSYLGSVSRTYKSFKLSMIYPATEAHVQKYSDQSFHMVVETKETYEKVTLPYIESIPPEKIEWVLNILEYKSESDRIIYENKNEKTGFMLLPDFKWSDMSNLESICCLAIVRDCSLRSLRDLRGCHLQLLQNIKDEGLAAIENSFKIPRSQMRVFVHYQPTYYHLHVHFAHIRVLHGIHTGKAVLLDDIIYNLSRNADHYEQATLSFVIGEVQHSQLFERLVEANILSVSI